MYYTAMRKALICVYRSGLIFCFVLTMDAGCNACTRNKENKKVTESAPQTLLHPSFVLKESNDAHQGNKRKRKHGQNIDPSDAMQPPIKKVKKLKRVAKVEEGKQAIVLLHGLNRISYDFEAMKAVLKQKFPHARIIALKSVDKGLKKNFLWVFSASATMQKTIREQAQLAYEELKEKVVRGSHVVLVGHSQGGLRGFTLVKEYTSCLKREHEVVINQLITIGTPWKGAPMLDHSKNIEHFKQKFNKIVPTLDAMHENYSKAVIKCFFRFMPKLACKWPGAYETLREVAFHTNLHGVENLSPDSDFIRHDVALGLKEVDVPITAIAGVLTNFSELFDPFSSSIGPQALAEVNAIYAELIGGDPSCEHDMLLPVGTQHAEGLPTKEFKRIKVYGACHGNKVGISVRRGLSELNNTKVIEAVVKSIEETFYEYKAEEVVENE